MCTYMYVCMCRFTASCSTAYTAAGRRCSTVRRSDWAVVIKRPQQCHSRCFCINFTVTCSVHIYAYQVYNNNINIVTIFLISQHHIFLVSDSIYVNTCTSIFAVRCMYKHVLCLRVVYICLLAGCLSRLYSVSERVNISLNFFTTW